MRNVENKQNESPPSLRKSVLSPRVSVIMPVYNGEKYLADAVESILTQTFTDFEFFIIDDGSTDGTAEIVKHYANRDKRIRFLQHERNQGQTAAQNRGIKEASGKYIARMDADDVSLPQRLERQVNFLDANPDIGVVGVGHLIVDQNLEPLVQRDRPKDHAVIVLNLLLSGFSLSGGSMMIRHDTLKSVGGFDSRYRVNDWELFVRLAPRTRFVNLPERLYLYRRHDHSITKVLNSELWDEWREYRMGWFHQLLGEAPDAAARDERFARLGKKEKLALLEGLRLRREVKKATNALIAANYVDEVDRSVLEAEFARLLESTTPRLWQKFCHWRRHRLGF